VVSFFLRFFPIFLASLYTPTSVIEASALGAFGVACFFLPLSVTGNESNLLDKRCRYITIPVSFSIFLNLSLTARVVRVMLFL
jgi:hypothetical protein